MSSTLGCVAAVMAIVSPSQLSPPVIHKTSISDIGEIHWSARPLASMRKEIPFDAAYSTAWKTTRPIFSLPGAPVKTASTRRECSCSPRSLFGPAYIARIRIYRRISGAVATTITINPSAATVQIAFAIRIPSLIFPLPYRLGNARRSQKTSLSIPLPNSVSRCVLATCAYRCFLARMRIAGSAMSRTSTRFQYRMPCVEFLIQKLDGNFPAARRVAP